jgi:hypothetical protein
MPIDLDMLRQKHAELSAGPSSGNSDFLSKFMQVKEGTNVVRILPWKDDDHLFYAETKIHRVPMGEGRDRNIHCRKVQGEACPVCDAYFALWNEPYTNEDLARKIKPRARYYLNVVDRATEEVKILSIGVILFKKIIAAMLDEDFGDITDLENGNDFKIVKVMEGQWPRYDQSAPRPKSDAAGNPAQVAAWMESLHDIHSLIKLEDYDDLKNVSMELLGTAPESSEPQTNEGDATSTDDYLDQLKS